MAAVAAMWAVPKPGLEAMRKGIGAVTVPIQ